MKLWLTLTLGGFICACSTTNKDANILATEKYSAVTYVAETAKNRPADNTVTVTTRGYDASIKNTIPQLYDRALEEMKKSGKSRVNIGNIRLTHFTKKEPFQVSYQDCRTVSKPYTVSNQNCSGSGTSTRCYTSYSTQYRSEQECQTKYRTEIRVVLYQKAEGDIYYLDNRGVAGN